MQGIFQAVLYQPILNVFVWLYNLIPDVGVAIILITLLLKLILYPLTKSSIKAQKSLSEIQPKLEELKKKYKSDQQKLAQETMLLYKENKVNPLGSCLPLLIQIPVFLAIYWVFRDGLTSQSFELLYPFVKNPGTINTLSFFGLFDLGKPHIALAVAAAASQYWQAKMMQSKQPPKEAGVGGKDESMMSAMNKQMLYFMPGLTFFIGLSLPGGLSLYWFISTLLTALQQKITLPKSTKTVPSLHDGTTNITEGVVEDIEKK